MSKVPGCKPQGNFDRFLQPVFKALFGNFCVKKHRYA